MAELLIKF